MDFPTMPWEVESWLAALKSLKERAVITAEMEKQFDQLRLLSYARHNYVDLKRVPDLIDRFEIAVQKMEVFKSLTNEEKVERLIQDSGMDHDQQYNLRQEWDDFLQIHVSDKFLEKKYDMLLKIQLGTRLLGQEAITSFYQQKMQSILATNSPEWVKKLMKRLEDTKLHKWDLPAWEIEYRNHPFAYLIKDTYEDVFPYPPLPSPLAFVGGISGGIAGYYGVDAIWEWWHQPKEQVTK